MHSQVEGDGQDGFDEGGVVVAVENGPHDLIGVRGGEKPEHFAFGGKRLDCGQNGYDGCEPNHGGTKPATDFIIPEERDTDQEDAKERGPFEEGKFGVTGVGGVARDPLKKAPKDSKEEGDHRPRKAQARKTGAPDYDPGEREYPDLKDSDRPIARHPQCQDGEEEERGEGYVHSSINWMDAHEEAVRHSTLRG